MAKKKTEESGQEDGVLRRAARAVGEAAGKIATAIGVAKPHRKRLAKLQKKNKSRLPRKQKKAAKKAGQEVA